MKRKLHIILSIVIGIVITNLLKLKAPEYLLDSETMIKTVLLSFAWFMIFVGVAYLSFLLLNRKKTIVMRK
jgi:hypothetical protein